MSPDVAQEITLDQIEMRYSINLPALHRRIILDPSDPIHQCCTLLTNDFEQVNEYLHGPRSVRPWPPFLIAFAYQPKDTSGDGDIPEYFAYDMRFPDTRIVLISMHRTIERCLYAQDRFVFSSIEEWYSSRLERHRVFGI